MAKKKHPGRTGRPPIYGERVVWLCRLPIDLAAAAETWREKRGWSQARLVQEAVERLIRKKA